MWSKTSRENLKPIDFDVLEESALAMAQATMYKAMKESGIKKADLARGMNRPRSFITRMLTGSHNLTVKTFARAMAACGFELRFEKRPIKWGWVAESTHVIETQHLPASAGSPVATCRVAAGVPADLRHITEMNVALGQGTDHLELSA